MEVEGSGIPGNNKDLAERTLKSLRVSLGRLWRRRTVTITEYDPTYKCAYLGNVLTGWAKGEGCVEKPLSTLWKNYTSSSKADVQMKVSVTQSGLKAVTKEHGLTEYWSHRITYCAAPSAFPRIFCWVYRHEGRKLKQELRCHAVLCAKETSAKRMAAQLRAKLTQALHEFKRDKICRQNARLSLANSVYDNPSLPRRKILLSTGAHNYRPPLERSKSAPKLMAIEESLEEDASGSDEIRAPRHSRFLLRLNSVPVGKPDMKQLGPSHVARLLCVEEEEDAVVVKATPTTTHVFQVTPVTEDDVLLGDRRFTKSPLVRRESVKRVNWATYQEQEDEESDDSLQSISSSEEEVDSCPKADSTRRLSDDGETESDESGYAESTTTSVDKEEVVKSILRGAGQRGTPHCVQV